MSYGSASQAKAVNEFVPVSPHCLQRLRTSERRYAVTPVILGSLDRAVDLPASRIVTAKRFVYVLRSSIETSHFYVGLTSDVDGRLAEHNAGRCPHTARHRPWQLHVVIQFPDEARASRFERYLKSGSGRAFAKRHFEP